MILRIVCVSYGIENDLNYWILYQQKIIQLKQHDYQKGNIENLLTKQLLDLFEFVTLISLH